MFNILKNFFKNLLTISVLCAIIRHTLKEVDTMNGIWKNHEAINTKHGSDALPLEAALDETMEFLWTLGDGPLDWG